MILRQCIDIFILQDYTKECSEVLNIKSMRIEDAVEDLIDIFERYCGFAPHKSSETQGS